jgi:hypothetical protein
MEFSKFASKQPEFDGTDKTGFTVTELILFYFECYLFLNNIHHFVHS